MIPVYGLVKTSLLDYSGHLASTIFLGHCNFNCPFCQNSTLIGTQIQDPPISEEVILSHLKKRKNILEGVCITGGEPTLYKGLPKFIESIKSMGYLVKLDTNGTNPAMLSSLIQDHLIDYVAMDIKNCKERYEESSGCNTPALSSLEQSVQLLKKGTLPYEFRTTVVKELHCLEDLKRIGEWLMGPSTYYLQNFKDSKHVVRKGLHPFSQEELAQMKSVLLPYLPNTHIRGEF